MAAVIGQDIRAHGLHPRLSFAFAFRRGCDVCGQLGELAPVCIGEKQQRLLASEVDR